MMSWTLLFRGGALLLLLATLGAEVDLHAQRPGSSEAGWQRHGGGRGERRGMTREDRARREALRERAVAAFSRLAPKESSKKLRQRFDGMSRQTVRRLSASDVAKFEALGDAELVRSIVKGWLAQRRRHDDRLLSRLDESVRGQVEGLEGEARHRKILELYAAAIMERALEKAARQGMVSPDEAASLRALPPEEAMDAVRGLHRKMILFVHRDEINEAERVRLEALSDSAFFRDGRVRRLRFGPHLGRKQMRSLESLSEDQRRRLVQTLRDPQGDVAQLTFLNEDVRSIFGEMSSEARKRFARMAKRMLFHRRHLYRPSRRVFGQLSETDRRTFMELPDDAARFAFLEKRFPKEDWVRSRDSWAAREEIRTVLRGKGHLMRGLDRGEDATIAKRLRKAGLDEASVTRILTLRKRLKPSARRGGRGRGPREGRGGRGPGRELIESLKQKLSPEEREALEALKDPGKRMEWLRKRFPESFSRRGGPGRREGASPPRSGRRR